jgi:methylated-DNA-[protein]-cysteine S-methyltransferase
LLVEIFYYDTAIGQIGIAGLDGRITHLFLPNDSFPRDFLVCETPLLKTAAAQLQSYLQGELSVFSLPLAPAGTPFMQQVWACISKIPYGRTASYHEIADLVGSPRAARAVGLANHRNPIPIFIPCHRVVGANGSLTGYRGGLELKRRLLAIEGITQRKAPETIPQC